MGGRSVRPEDAAERRWGEGAGQDWADVDLDAGLITPAKVIVVDGWDPYESAPKTDGSASTIALDSLNVAVLRGHRERQLKEKEKCRHRLAGHRHTQEDGSWLHLETVSERPRVPERWKNAYSRSPSAASRETPNCSGVHTMTAEGFSPVARQRAARRSVHSSGFGRLPDSSST